jgi:hypothetical protein
MRHFAFTHSELVDLAARARRLAREVGSQEDAARLLAAAEDFEAAAQSSGEGVVMRHEQPVQQAQARLQELPAGSETPADNPDGSDGSST